MDAEDLSDTLLAMGGRSHITPEADLAGNGNAIDASEALAAKELHNNSALMGLIENWKTRLDSYTEKSESATTGLGKEKRHLTGEERLTFLNRAVELKLVLADIGNLLADAASYEPTTQRKAVGSKTRRNNSRTSGCAEARCQRIIGTNPVHSGTKRSKRQAGGVVHSKREAGGPVFQGPSCQEGIAVRSAPSADIKTGTTRRQSVDTEPTYTEILEITPEQYEILNLPDANASKGTNNDYPAK
jgi:hypothetical protein